MLPAIRNRMIAVIVIAVVMFSLSVVASNSEAFVGVIAPLGDQGVGVISQPDCHGNTLLDGHESGSVYSEDGGRFGGGFRFWHRFLMFWE